MIDVPAIMIPDFNMQFAVLTKAHVKHEQDSFSKVSLWLMEQISCVVPITVLTKMLAVVYALKFLYCYLKGTNFKV